MPNHKRIKHQRANARAFKAHQFSPDRLREPKKEDLRAMLTQAVQNTTMDDEQRELMAAVAGMES